MINNEKQLLLKMMKMASKLIKHITIHSIDCARYFDEINRVLSLENKVAAFSSFSVVEALRPTLHELSSMEIEPATEVYCRYLEEVAYDLARGIEAADILDRYDNKLHSEKNPNKIKREANP